MQQDMTQKEKELRRDEENKDSQALIFLKFATWKSMEFCYSPQEKLWWIVKSKHIIIIFYIVFI